MLGNTFNLSNMCFTIPNFQIEALPYINIAGDIDEEHGESIIIRM